MDFDDDDMEFDDDNDREFDDGMEHFRPMHPCFYCGDDCDCLEGQDEKDCEGCPDCRNEEDVSQGDDDGEF